MARSNSSTQSSSSKRTPKEAPRNKGKKPAPFPNNSWIDYKDVNMLRRFMSDRGKIRARRVTGANTQKQRELAQAIKTARELALLPYAQRTTTERTGRGPRSDRRNNDAEGQAAERSGVDTEETNVPVADGDVEPGRADQEMQ